MNRLSNIFKTLLTETALLFNEVSAKSPCDCCQYFDWTFSQAGGYYGGLTNPLYYEIQKQERHEIRYITPEKYMREISKGFHISYEEGMNSNAINWDKVKKYAEDMKGGAKFPIGFYKANGSQEGRHRALALMQIGCQEMPVVLMTNLNRDDVLEIVNNLKDLPREKIDQIYKSKGYDGITDLDWRELHNYIKYRL